MPNCSYFQSPPTAFAAHCCEKGGGKEKSLFYFSFFLEKRKDDKAEEEGGISSSSLLSRGSRRTRRRPSETQIAFLPPPSSFLSKSPPFDIIFPRWEKMTICVYFPPPPPRTSLSLDPNVFSFPLFFVPRPIFFFLLPSFLILSLASLGACLGSRSDGEIPFFFLPCIFLGSCGQPRACSSS